MQPLDQKKTQPVLVTAIMASAICNHVPMIDGLLISQMHRKRLSVIETRNGHRHDRQHAGGWGDVPIPLASGVLGGWWIPRASAPIYKARAEDVANITRIPDFDWDAIRPGGANKINVTSGSFKGMRLPKRVIVVDRVCWFAVARQDDASRSPEACLRRRIKRLAAIGGKTEIGFGRVLEWRIDPVEEDLSWWATDDHGRQVLMRPLPVCDDLPQDLAGAREWFDRPAPPYHDKRTACRVVVPC